MSTTTTHQDRSIISLFSGAMGLDLGFESVHKSLKTSVAVEIDPVAVRTIKLNKPELPVFAKSIEAITSKELMKASKTKKREIFAVIGGPCCQSFSTVGKRGSLGDTRGGLFRHFTRVVKETQPRFFVMENVKGVLSAAVQHRPLNQRGPGHPYLKSDEELGSALKVICEELAALRYNVIFSLINCADYGVPQKRMRVIFIGSRDGEPIKIPKATHTENGTRKWLTLDDALSTLNTDTHEYLEFSPERKDLLRLLKSGQNWKHLPEHLHQVALGEAFHSWGGRVGFCRKLSWDRPAPTLTTAPNGRATTLCHPNEIRPLSIEEYACLQQFPKSWRFAGNTRQKYSQIGNAVPIGLGKAVARMLLRISERTDSGKHIPDPSLLGQVKCVDALLEQRISKRRRTTLNPPFMRSTTDPKAARDWISHVSDD